jgi:hypothetical protein
VRHGHAGMGRKMKEDIKGRRKPEQHMNESIIE